MTRRRRLLRRSKSIVGGDRWRRWRWRRTRRRGFSLASALPARIAAVQERGDKDTDLVEHHDRYRLERHRDRVARQRGSDERRKHDRVAAVVAQLAGGHDPGARERD